MTQGSQFQSPQPRGTDPTTDGSKTDEAKQQGREVASHAKDEAASVAQDAKREGQQVAETAKEEVRQVASSAQAQARQLMDQARTELGDQAGSQQQRLAGNIRNLASELQTMVRSNDENGPMNDLAQQAADKAGDVANWLENRQPGEVLDDVRRFAARRPAMFLALAAGAGVLAGRLTRGLTADDDSAQSARAYSGGAQLRGGERLGGQDDYRSRQAGWETAVDPVDPQYRVPTGGPVPNGGTAPTGVPPQAGHPLAQQPGLDPLTGQPDQAPRDPRWSAATGGAPADPRFDDRGGR